MGLRFGAVSKIFDVELGEFLTRIFIDRADELPCRKNAQNRKTRGAVVEDTFSFNVFLSVNGRVSIVIPFDACSAAVWALMRYAILIFEAECVCFQKFRCELAMENRLIRETLVSCFENQTTTIAQKVLHKAEGWIELTKNQVFRFWCCLHLAKLVNEFTIFADWTRVQCVFSLWLIRHGAPQKSPDHLIKIIAFCQFFR